MSSESYRGRKVMLDRKEPGVFTAAASPAGRTETLPAAWADCPVPEKTVPGLFAERVAGGPDRPALIAGRGEERRELSYRELDLWTDWIAGQLLERGLGRGDIVAVHLPRSAVSVAAYLGVLKAGGAYLPVHPDLPAERKRRMLADARVRIVIEDASRENQAQDLALIRLSLDDWPAPSLLEAGEASDISRLSPPGFSELHPEDGAYVLYTSGSTGEPKGILVPHAGIVRLLIRPNYFEPGPHLRLTFAASIAFDVSVFEIWGALVHGGILILVAEDLARRPRDFADLIREERVNTMMLPPALMQLIAEEVPGAFAGVHDLIYAGEPAAPGFIARLLQEAPPARLINGYGLTELSVLSTYHEIRECDGKSSLPIGGPISGSRLYVLDENLEPVPGREEPGELYIGGIGLANGYLNRPDLTAERFLPDPFGEPGTRMYRSGDLVRWNEAGELLYLGRVDRQIKLRGLRIEPGEIENCLARHPGVKAVAVRSYGEKENRIGAWVVADARPDAEAARELQNSLRAFAADQLPEYMIPSSVFFLGELPLSPNGKVNYRELPRPKNEGIPGGVAGKTNEQNRQSPPAGGKVRPASATEALLVWLFAELLNRETVGVREGFLELGGDSLLAMRLAGRIQDQFGLRLSPRQIFLSNTVRSLAAELDGLLADSSREKNANPAPRAPAARDRSRFPLTSSQRRIWYLEKLGEGAAYHIPLAFRLKFSSDGRSEKEILRRALGEIVRRHAILRTVFGEADGEPFQEILPPGPPALEEETVPPENRSARLRACIDEPFDLARTGGLRLRYLSTGAREAVLLIVLHHLVEDGWSVGVLLRELQELYTAGAQERPSSLERIELQYADFVGRQSGAPGEVEGNSLKEAALDRLARRLGGIEPVELPLDHSRPEVMESRGAELRFSLDPQLTARLGAFNRERGVTTFMTLQALFWVWLHRITGRETILTATQTAGRDEPAAQNLIGFFADIKLLRGDIDRERSFSDVLETARTETHSILEPWSPAYERLVERLKPVRDRSRNPLFNLAYFHQEAAAMNPRLGLPGVQVEPVDLPWHTVRMDLELHTYEEEGCLHGRCVYSPALFEAESVAAYLGIFRRLLEECLDDPARPVGRLSLLNTREREELLFDRNPDRRVYPERPLTELFEEWARRTPDAPAVFDGERTLTYGELNAAANRLAAYLRGQNVPPGSTVAVRLGRSADLIVCWLGIMKARAVYLPLDPDAPAERNAAIIQNASPVLTVDSLGSLGLAEMPDVNPGLPVALDDPAYVMYTSGSTGAPKGVLVFARGIVRLVFGNAFAELRPGDRTAFASHVSFDASTYEVWAALLHGAAVVVLRREEILEPAVFARRLRERKITALLQTPALFNHTLNAEPEIFRELTHLMVGGDALDPRAMRLALTTPPENLWNLYGPTEGAVVAAFLKIKSVAPDARSIPLGRPVNGSRCYILDEFLEPLPPGLPGELYIGGDCVAAGYLGDPTRTAERFLPDPFGPPGTRMYHTGDRARWNREGQIEFLGRADRQIKIRGFRMEPGEIEFCLRNHPAVCDVVVKPFAVKDGGKTLHAHLATGGESSEAELREYARGKLPGYMVPERFFLYETLPVSPAGKVSYNELVPPAGKSSAQGEAKDGNEVVPTGIPVREKLREDIREIWRAVLKHDSFGNRDHFFEAGGHSLALLALLHRLRELDASVSLAELFEYPTVEALVGRIGGKPGLPGETAGETNRHSGSLPSPVAPAVGLDTSEDFIAIIGMSGRFPGAPDLESFRDNLYAGRETISRFSREELIEFVDADFLDHPDYVRAGGFVEDIESFDAEFFGVNAREAEMLPAEDRLFMEECFRVLQYAGYDPARKNIGLYAGSDPNSISASRLLESYSAAGLQYPVLTATRGDFLCSRIAYRLNLTGPVLFIQTACSTSLVAVHTACQALLREECDMALAGAVSLLAPRQGYLYQAGGIFSPDGHCRAFDQDANGVVQGSGIGVVVLKPLRAARRDGDTIHAVIRGTAVTNDGADKIGFTAPSARAQERLLRSALERARLAPNEIGYVEAHGTGTSLGDMIEMRALRRVFGDDGELTIGSVKTNIGHASAASGMAGLFKTVFALRSGTIPPTLHFRQPNREIFGASKLSVNASELEWPAPGLRRAGVSSFGLGGTCSHAVLEASPESSAPSAGESANSREKHVFLFSAKTAAALDRLQNDLIERFESDPKLDLADAAYTLMAGRPRYQLRRFLIATGRERLLDDLRHGRVETIQARADQPDAGPVFLFPGQGSLTPGLGRELYAGEREFRKTVDECSAVLGRSPERIFAWAQADDLAQAALFIFEYALARLMIDWGMRPAALLGHSLGEYTAAAVAGVFDPAELLPLLVARERLMRETMPPARMLAVFSKSDALTLPEGIYLSTAAPGAGIVCGAPERIEAYRESLDRESIDYRSVNTQRAFHSPAVDAMMPAFAEEFARIELREPTIPLLSNRLGGFAGPGEVTTAEYWLRHTREPVRMSENITHLLNADPGLLLELGPGRTLSAFVKRHPRGAGRPVLGVLPRPEQGGEYASFMNWLGRIAGHDRSTSIDWDLFYGDEKRGRVPLPAHPLLGGRIRDRGAPAEAPASPGGGNMARGFQTRTPVPPVDSVASDARSQKGNGVESGLSPSGLEERLAGIWRETLFVPEVNSDSDFLALGGDSLMAVHMVTRIRDLLGVQIKPADLLSNPRLSQLLELIRARGGAAEKTSGEGEAIFAVRESGRGEPLFLVCPIDVTPLCYLPLARQLDRPVYALQTAEDDIDKVEALADFFLNALRASFPGRSYLMGGWSYGGLVAYEMVRRLEEQGEKAGLLLLDSRVGGAGKQPGEPDPLARLAHLAELQLLSLETLITMSPDELLRYVSVPLKNLWSGLAAVWQSGGNPGPSEPFPALFGRMTDAVPFLNLMLRPRARRRFLSILNYIPRPVRAPVVVVHAQRLLANREKDRAGLEGLIQGKLEVIEASGNHETFLWPGHASDFGPKLDAVLTDFFG